MKNNVKTNNLLKEKLDFDLQNYFADFEYYRNLEQPKKMKRIIDERNNTHNYFS